MNTDLIFNLQTVFSLVLFGMIAAWYVWPRFKTMNYYDIMVAMMIVAAFRYLGTSFAVPNMTDGLSTGFAVFGAKVDLVVSIIAILGAFAFRAKQGWGVLFAWIYAILGTADFIYNGSRLMALGVPTHIGPLMWLMTVGGPIWMVQLVLFWKLLIKPINKN
jgi:hypothetical protein